MRRLLDTLNLLLATGLVGFAVWAWPRLPDQVPTHFGPDGVVDRWSETTLLSWFALPAVALGLWAVVAVLRGWIVRNPARITLPSGGTLADRPVEVHPPVIEQMRIFMALVAAELLIIFGFIVVGSYRTAMGGDAQGTMLAVLAVAILSGPVLLIVFMMGMSRALAGAEAGGGWRAQGETE